MDKTVNSSKGISDQVSLVPEFSWVRRNRGLLAALFLAGGSALVSFSYFGTDKEGIEPHSEIFGKGEGLGNPVPVKPDEPEIKVSETPPNKVQSGIVVAPKKAISGKSDMNRVSVALDSDRPDRWSDMESKQRMAATLFVGLTQGEESYNMLEEAEKCGFNGIEGFQELLDSFDRLTDALARDGSDSVEIRKSAQGYLRSYDRFTDNLNKPEVREAFVRIVHSIPVEADEKSLMTTVRMGGIYAYCLAEGKCTMEAIVEAESHRQGR